jgi:very-short-patch-repair endonuclease
VVTREAISVTAPVRTLVDLASEIDARRLERAINDADKLDLVNPETLRASLDRYRGEPGVRPLRALLDAPTFRLSDSDLEVAFRAIAAAAGLPPPATKETVNGFVVDFFWRDLGLVVETDGLRYHRTPSTQARDARRDRAHLVAGMTPLRFTHWEIARRPGEVERQLEQAARLLANRGAH